MKKKLISIRFLLVASSILLYISSMFFTPFYVATADADIYANSFHILLVGWMAILGGGLAPTIIWLANPLYFVAVFFIMNRVKFGVAMITISLGLAIYFTTLRSIMDGESGAMTKITELGTGFYLWILSFKVLFCAGLNLFQNNHLQKTKN